MIERSFDMTQRRAGQHAADRKRRDEGRDLQLDVGDARAAAGQQRRRAIASTKEP